MDNKNIFKILQLNDKIPESIHCMFAPYHAVSASICPKPVFRLYKCVWEEELPDDPALIFSEKEYTVKAHLWLEDLFFRFNNDHPVAFKGHSLSVSDVIEVHKDGDICFFYCDPTGFQQLSPTEFEYSTAKEQKGSKISE